MNEESIITREDIDYLAEQPNERINFIIAGMTALLNDVDSKAEMLANEKWYQRMLYTVLGKNKATVNEIKQNHAKLSLYIVKSIEELYRRECVELSLIYSVRNQILEVANEQKQIKQRILDLVGALDEKVNAIDRYNLLKDEIQMGKYSHFPPLIAISVIISQLDNHILKDTRKMDIISKSIREKINLTEEKCLDEFLKGVLELSEKQLGFLCIGLRDIQKNYIAHIILEIIERYYFQSEIAKKMTDKKGFIKSILKERSVNSSITLSVEDIYNTFIEDKINSLYLKPAVDVEENDEEKNNESMDREKKIEEIKNNLFLLISNICDDIYYEKMNGIIESLSYNWYNIYESAENIEQNKKLLPHYIKVFLSKDKYCPLYKDFVGALAEKIASDIRTATGIGSFDDIFVSKLKKIFHNAFSDYGEIMTEISKRYIEIQLDAEKYIKILSRSDAEWFFRGSVEGLTIIPLIDRISGGKISKFYGVENEQAFVERVTNLLFSFADIINDLIETYDNFNISEVELELCCLSNQYIDCFIENTERIKNNLDDYLEEIVYKNKLREESINK